MFYSITSIAPICTKLHQEGTTIVLATGFFDLLHAEHIKFLKKAKTAGDILVVAVESDARARKIKGEGRPIETQSIRCQNIAQYADFVIALADDFDHFEAYASLMASVRPDIYAVSSHTDFQPNKALLTEKYGGKLVVVHEFNSKISTTQIINGLMV